MSRVPNARRFLWVGVAAFVTIGLGYMASRAGLGYGARAFSKVDFGPETLGGVTRVRGQVTYFGRAAGSGWVEFIPIDGTVGLLRSGPLDRDGAFHADRVPVGKVAMGVILPGFRRQ